LPKIVGGVFLGLFVKVREMECHHETASPL
jgi:hypothetical protein